MKVLSIDLETYSSVDLKKTGVYPYVSSPDFEILLFGYAFDDQPVQIVDKARGERIPDIVLKALRDPCVLKTAFNANFERTCLHEYFRDEMPADQWQCSAVQALTLGLPHTLDGVSKVLKLPADKAKMSIGKSLIAYFCKPCKPTKTNEQRTRNLPTHDLEKWNLFKTYCAADVEAERAARKLMLRFQPPEEERKLWALDQRINEYGVKVDQTLVAHAIACDTAYQKRLIAEAVELTGLDNPKSVAQLKKWLEDAEGIEIDSLNKESVPVLLKQTESDTVKRVLELRQETSKTSVKKYEAMARAVCPDSRIRGLLQFYGANRTGRWAGRLVQVQNLPQNKLKDLDLARQLLRAGEYEMLELLFGNVPGVLSQLIRTAFIPEEGSRFIVSDFSAIEARVIAWLAGEQWRLDVFASHGKIYEASAAQMFKVPIESIDKNSQLRQKGKVAELALGYQGGPGALVKMGALKNGLTEEELPALVKAWREANPHIVQLWWAAQKAAIEAVMEKSTVAFVKGIVFKFESGMLFIKLPSGRRLAYVRPRIEIDEKFQKPSLTYEGMDQETKQWGRLKTYGGKLVENIVQAVARDCLREAMFRADDAGYKIGMHVHDEIVCEVPFGFGSVDHLGELMGKPIPWAPGLQLRGDGYETAYYKKDD
ncbi:DNA polymerase [Anaerospora hongkongensis]|uniref:DNA polymerase n=1 Tax=Anaerospora hongkongensis TaxID=244830 RepID=UPI0028A29D17|nr:DNA polymerase [Anaerospora hongkongensis]